MKEKGKEFLVGCLVLLVVGLLVLFGWLMGVVGSWKHQVAYQVLYSFAGGVEVGSPVRVSGVKVGRVENIAFLPQPQATTSASNNPTLRVTVSVSKTAAPVVRQDSKFYVNMAGIIGERYIEISPGTPGAAPLSPGTEVRGVDPPRIDQLISQGYGVFGKIQDFLDENESVVTDFLGETTSFLKEANQMLKDANRLLKGEDKRKLVTLVDNLNQLTGDLKNVTRHLQDEKNQRFVDELRDLVDRAHSIDHQALKKFFQDEGVRAHIF